MFSGSITALVTPMHPNGEIAYDSLYKLIDRQIDAGTHGLVINGTTSEVPTLTHEEQLKILQATVKQVNHRIPVIAGTGSYSTHQAIKNTQAAMQAGADACLVVTPYYNRPTQQGLYEHYKAVAESVPAPLILYNVPSRTGCDLLPATIEKLASIANIVGLKECVMNTSRIEELIARTGERLSLLSGNDEDALPAMLLGFKGVISVISNAIPVLMRKMCEAALSGDKITARSLNQRLIALQQQCFVESNPIPIKWLLSDCGLIPDGIRLPLTKLSPKHHDALRAAFRQTEESV